MTGLPVIKQKNNFLRVGICALSLVLSHLACTPLFAQTEDSSGLKGLEWRLIGPYRGGRVTTVAGVADNPLLYYMGATGGGVWKTENAGVTRIGSIKALFPEIPSY